MSLVAAIDVGSNTVRMLVARTDGGTPKPVLRMRRITGMGRALRSTGAIGEGEFRASIAALRAFRREMDRLGVGMFRACGTAALREASNAVTFREAAARAGVPLEVVPAAEEARLTWEGVTGGAGRRDGTIVADIGGGSTEFAAGPGPGDSVSLPLGVVVLLAMFPLSDPPERWQAENLGFYLADRVAAGTARFAGRRFRRFVGTAGTFTTLAALDLRMRTYRPERINGHRMTRGRVRAWAGRLCGMTDAARLALPGMEKGRERTIVPGALLAAASMERFGARRLEISDAGLLEGILGSLPVEQGGRHR